MKEIEAKYFFVSFFKKGIAHILFKDLDLLKQFNRFAAQRKGWLPPSYGKADYNRMDDESKAVINSFEGSDFYEADYNAGRIKLFPVENF